MIARLVFVTLLVLGTVSPLWADAFRTPALRLGKPVSIQAYGGQNASCLEWTDGCVVCTRGPQRSSCSTPGIACTPAGLTCKRLVQPAAKP